MGHCKCSPKGKVHSNTGIPQETRFIKSIKNIKMLMSLTLKFISEEAFCLPNEEVRIMNQVCPFGRIFPAVFIIVKVYGNRNNLQNKKISCDHSVSK